MKRGRDFFFIYIHTFFLHTHQTLHRDWLEQLWRAILSKNVFERSKSLMTFEIYSVLQYIVVRVMGYIVEHHAICLFFLCPNIATKATECWLARHVNEYCWVRKASDHLALMQYRFDGSPFLILEQSKRSHLRGCSF